MQAASSLCLPTQTLPLNLGFGLLQLLNLDLTAIPQVALQPDQDDQADQAPWTVQLLTSTLLPKT